MYYNANLATDLLRKLQKNDIPFTKEYSVDMSLTVCGYSLK